MKNLNLKEISSEQLLNELYYRDDVIIVQYYLKHHFQDIFESEIESGEIKDIDDFFQYCSENENDLYYGVDDNLQELLRQYTEDRENEENDNN